MFCSQIPAHRSGGMSRIMMDERTLQAIEFPRALDLLARRCLSAPGREAAAALRPRTEPAAVRVLQEEAGEALRSLASE